MSIELVSAISELVPEIARIGYEAFLKVSSEHGFPPDFPSVEAAVPAYQLLIDREDYFGLIALVDGRPVGSNFLMRSDQIASIGPLSVDPAYQGHGIGRLLMSSLLAHAAVRGFTEIRLLQDTFNVTSLALYRSLGFEVRDTVALIHTFPLNETCKNVRPLVGGDLGAVDRLCRSHYNTSRLNEIITATKYGFPTYICERDEIVTGYYMPGLIGHGISETDEDAIALISEVTRIVPKDYRKFLCPMHQSTLFQQSLKIGWKIEKLLTYMTLGLYKDPTGVCTPSACY